MTACLCGALVRTPYCPDCGGEQPTDDASELQGFLVDKLRKEQKKLMEPRSTYYGSVEKQTAQIEAKIALWERRLAAFENLFAKDLMS